MDSPAEPLPVVELAVGLESPVELRLVVELLVAFPSSSYGSLSSLPLLNKSYFGKVTHFDVAPIHILIYVFFFFSRHIAALGNSILF